MQYEFFWFNFYASFIPIFQSSVSLKQSTIQIYSLHITCNILSKFSAIPDDLLWYHALIANLSEYNFLLFLYSCTTSDKISINVWCLVVLSITINMVCMYLHVYSVPEIDATESTLDQWCSTQVQHIHSMFFLESGLNWVELTYYIDSVTAEDVLNVVTWNRHNTVDFDCFGTMERDETVAVTYQYCL